MNSQYSEQDVAIYTILNGQKAASKYLQMTDEKIQLYLSRMLEREDGIPFFTKIRDLLLQFSKFLDSEELSNQFNLSSKILGLLSIRLEKDPVGSISVVPVKRRREGEVELLELNLNFKRQKTQFDVNQGLQNEETVYQPEDELYPPDPISNEENVNQFENQQFANKNPKKRGKRSKLIVDQNMLQSLRMIQEDTLKVKDLADRYGVSPACIYQIMKQHGFNAPNKGRGRKTRNEEEHQLMTLQNIQQGGMFTENQFSKMQQNGMQNMQHYRGQEVMNMVMNQDSRYLNMI